MFSSMFEEMAAKMAGQTQEDALRQAYNGFGTPGQQIFGGLGGVHQYQAQPQGTRVTREMENRMVLLRCGNLLLAARSGGWEAKLERGPGGWHMVFHRPGKQLLDGPWHSDRRGAVLLGAEAAERYL